MNIKRLPKRDCKTLVPDFGAKVRQAREECGLSQKELAREVGLESATAISLIESGERRLSAKMLNQIAHVTDLPVLFFFEDLTTNIS